MSELGLPDFDNLPEVKGMPKGTAWGLFDKNGKKDMVGTLNLLTPKVVQEAYKELKDGVSVSLNWPIGAIKTPGFGRKGLVHKVIHFQDTAIGGHGFDDEVEFNTQCSSQWDSLCHFQHQASESTYNGTKPTVADLTQAFGDEDKAGKYPTLHHWHARGGLVARGVFIDYRRYAEENNIKFNCFDADQIPLATIKKIAADKGVQFKEGDVLIIRSGFTEELGRMNGEEQVQAMSSHRVCGVEGTDEVAKWVWNQHFSAVAGDMIAFEQIPPIVNGKEAGITELPLHQYFIALYGMSIGELWDLKALSEHCHKTGRYSFLVASAPLNVPGGIGSPPNILALF